MNIINHLKKEFIGEDKAKMKWIKLGKLYNLEKINNYLTTHVSNPMPVLLSNDTYRIFYSGRDENNKSSIGYVDIDIIKKKIIEVCNKECFKFSDDENSFFSHGVSIGNFYRSIHNYVLFMGWKIEKNQHWKGYIGRLKLESDNLNFKLVGTEPFIKLDQEDKISISYPWVMKDNDIYKMWYGSTISWDAGNGEMLHIIKYATSFDGEEWIKHGLAIPYEIGLAQAFSHPTVIKVEGVYHMWFSFRSGTGQTYRIGYANSIDGIKWKRSDELSLDVSINGWDSEMTCYPYVFKHKEFYYMLYNGNEFGKSGFGLAILSK